MIDYIRPQLAPRTIESVGADARSSNFYLRIRACGYLRVDIACPSFLLGQRAEAQTGERVGIEKSFVEWFRELHFYVDTRY
jgi:hypothetical protein